jgi:twitching motility two-component system response regulator PilH
MAHVLVIDDSPTDQRLVQDLLARHGHLVSLARTAEEGLALIGQLAPDVVIMDVVMPGMSGFQAVRRLARDPATAHIPVILASVKDADSDRVWGMRQGARDYLTKPFTEDALLEAIRRHVHRAA